MSVAALIVAAGRGSRVGAGGPKQYWPIGGAPMLTRAIAAFASHPRIDDILVVIHPDDEALYRAASVPHAARLRDPVAGGARRQDSVRAGLEAFTNTGRIELANGIAGDTLTLPGTFAGTGGVLTLDVNPAVKTSLAPGSRP